VSIEPDGFPRESQVDRWRRKPVTVEAMRWSGWNLDDLDVFTGGGVLRLHSDPPLLDVWNSQGEAWIPCPYGHSVVRGVLDEFYPASPAALAAMFDPAVDDGVVRWDVTRVQVIDALREVVATFGLADASVLADSLLAVLDGNTARRP